ARDLSGVGMLGISNVLISATAGFPANTFQEAIALIKANPKKYSYASPGSGSALHLAMELLKQKAGIEMLHVPFRGNALMYPEVLAGRVDLMADPLYTSLRYVRTGKIKALALAGNRRSDLAPEIPTVSELAIPGFDVRSIFAVVVASRTPRDVVQKLHSDLTTVLRLPDTQKRMVELGIEPQHTTPEQLDAQFRSDLDRWAQLVKSAGITID
ncbi:MAG: tripartite tricarboxylate transporter substrate-binding protein, partial [Betaproteobacteria bacterium]